MKRFKEKQLLYKVQTDKDTQAYALLYDAYVTPIYRFVLLKVSHPHEAEDITSDVFLQAWDYLLSDRPKPVKNFRALIYSIARNKVIDLYRSRSNKGDQSLEYAAQQVSDTDTPDDRLQSQQEYSALLKSVKQLKEEYQEIIILRYLDELSLKEIGEVLGKKPSAVRVTLHRATKKLRDIHSL